MPTFTFRCSKCGYEADQRSLNAPKHCSLKMKRRYKAPSIRLDSFVDHEKKFMEWEANGEFDPPAGATIL